MQRVSFVLFFALVPIASSTANDSVSSEMVDAARHFLASLYKSQQAPTTFSFDDEERLNWHFIPKEREGLPIKSMSPAQRKLAHRLLTTGLSSKGVQKALDIMYLDHILFEKERRAIRDSDLYYFTVFGQPSMSNTWGFRIEGHHLSLNFTLRHGALVSTFPLFMGANPAVVRTGPLKGMHTLSDEELVGRKLIESFDKEKLNVALIANNAPDDIITGAQRKAMIGDPKGIPFSKMNTQQRKLLLYLVTTYANRLRSDVANHELTKIESASKESVHFAWAGGITQGDRHYYRIQGPSFLIEYDNTQNDANHVHTVWRDLSGDFGLSSDPLTEHYAKSLHPHQNKAVALEPH